MIPLILSFLGLLKLSGGALYLDKLEIETNKTLLTVDLQYVHNKRCEAVMNISVHTFRTVEKAMMYLRVNIAAHKNDKEFKHEFMRTRIDLVKLIHGLYGNAILKGFMDNIIKEIAALNLSVPVPPKLYQVHNLVIQNTDWLPLPNNTQGFFDIRFIGKVLGTKSNQFFAHIVTFGRFIKV